MNIFKIFELIVKIKEWLRGKKVYILCTTAILTTIWSWANNIIDTKTAVGAILLALEQMAQRAGKDNAAVKALTALPSQISGNDPVVN